MLFQVNSIPLRASEKFSILVSDLRNLSTAISLQNTSASPDNSKKTKTSKTKLVYGLIFNLKEKKML